jgi:hypothetical protein
MNRLGRFILLALAGSASIALVGCDWGSSGEGEDTWNDAYSWVNFTGVYRGTGGGVLVSDFTASGGVSTNGVGVTTNSIHGEYIETAVVGQSTYTGVFRYNGIVPGSVLLTAGVFVLTDDAGGGALAGSGKTGTIDYGTGAWSIDLMGEWPPGGTQIRADYESTGHVNGSSDSGGGDVVDNNSGATGITIYQFIVEQQGNNISFMDNNGSVYSGKLGRVSTTGGINQDNVSSTRTPTAGTTVFGDYNVTGTSKVGKQVRMVGSLQGVVMGAGSSISLANRVLLGTWLEKDGKTGQINGEAASVAINVPGVTNAIAPVTL